MQITVAAPQPASFYSKIFSIPETVLKAANPQICGLNSQKAQSVNIPGYYTFPHTIKYGETIRSIADQYKIPEQQLLAANEDSLPFLQAGSRINIPKKAEMTAATLARPYTYDAMIEWIEALTDLYPFIKRRVIGYSVLGKELVELRMGEGAKQIHINAAFHGNEWITTSVLLHFIYEYAHSHCNQGQFDGIKTIQLFQHVTLSCVPMVNPDGVDLVLNGSQAAESYQGHVEQINEHLSDFSRWKANIRGVDLNKQFPACWDLEAKRKPKSPHYRDFPGEKPLTEPEAIAVAELAKQRNFDAVHALHTQGEEIYWGFKGKEPKESAHIAAEYAKKSGYASIPYVDNYAGFKDWFIKIFQKPGFTLELGKGENPLPLEQISDIYEKTRPILFSSLSL